MCITMSSDTMADPVTSFSFAVGFHASQGRLLGMHLNEDKCLGDIYVSQVSPDISTLIGQWNAENPSDRICAGDQVVTINHKKGCPYHRYQLGSCQYRWGSSRPTFHSANTKMPESFQQ